MGFINRVNAGDTWMMTASTMNSIADCVNRIGRDGAGASRSLNDGSILANCYNASETDDIVSGSAVTICTGEYPAIDECIPVVPYDGSDRPCGIAVDDMMPNNVGTAIVGGVCTVDIDAASATGNQYIVPDALNPKVFHLSDSGIARLLALGQNGNESVVQFGSPSVNIGNEITGQFDVVLVKTSGVVTGVRLFNSSNPNGQYAGEVRIGSRNLNVPAETINIASGTIGVKVTYNPTLRTFTVDAGFNLTITNADYQCKEDIATISNGGITGKRIPSPIDMRWRFV